MKNILFIALALLCYSVKAQENLPTAVKLPAADSSPADIVYYPINAAKAKGNEATGPIIKVVYSRPQKKGREIFGVLEQYGNVWRFGANESTEIRFYKNVTVGNKKVKAGIYSLFAIPDKDKWTIIINKQTDKWGAFSYDQSKDVVRLDVPITILSKQVEYFTVTFTPAKDGANLIAAWDKTQVSLPISF
ncbi:DUF2911 domain-containing protein [Pedobacter sp. MW01-1-1]|uniref:DUF2911 domain-containing protein n=1 Tax=Pedobacter sp. MW01-1-1 TaxID=3383027 RepID=UPI003FEFE735